MRAWKKAFTAKGSLRVLRF
jgi:hypothetical protein